MSVAAKDPSVAKVPPASMKAKELLWELFTSDKESKSYSKLLDYMKGEDSVVEVDVPGCDPDLRHLKSTDLARLLTLSILEWFSWLHSAGWSLNGEISSDDIFLAPLGHAKMKKGKMKLLKRCKVKRRAKDMNAVANVIQGGIFRSGDIPYDIQHLLWLLRHFRSYYANLLLNHSSLLNESANLFLIRTIPQRLRQLSKLDPAKYRRIISKVPYCKMDQDHWKLRCQQNQYLMKILEPESPLSVQAQPTLAPPNGTQPPVALQISSIGPDYDNNTSGLLKFLWDCYWNIIDYSVGEVQEKKVVFPQLHQMFSVAFPQVICRCQKAMLMENELSHCMPNGPSFRDILK
ncbi:unnamed protein product [Urochloa decumbens]|uniref:Uncharacterized protein n=2 Tax=Urochloa decumbens TaxID=240449 RepID=A0ABC9GA49_9POAL